MRGPTAGRERLRRPPRIAVFAVALAAVVALAACDAGPIATPTPSPSPTFSLATASIDELLDRLDGGEATDRAEAAGELGKRGDAAAVPVLVEATDDPDADVVVAAVAALGAIGGAAAEARLLDLADAIEDVDTSEPDWELADARCEAVIAALGDVGGEAAIRRLLAFDVLSVDAPGCAFTEVGDALEGLDAGAVEALAAIARDKDPELAAGAVEWVAKVGGGKSYDALVAVLAVGPIPVKAAAITALGQLGDTRATGAIVKAVSGKKRDDFNASLFWPAYRALATLHADAAGPLLGYLKAAKTVWVYRALVSIGQAGTERALTTALTSCGFKRMAEDYLNCGNDALESAAKRWARSHGYTIITSTGGASATWGD